METASFGEWVRRRRLTLDLTQAELARRVACASITVRKIEADERRPSKLMAERLADALELAGDAHDRFVASARAVVSPARLPSPAVPAEFGPSGHLPAPATRCLGRDDEVADVLDRLDLSGGPARLLTITGPPGVGKTRLAVEVASRAERKFDTPVVFVDLSPFEDPVEVPARIAGAVATPSAALVDALDLAIHALRRNPALLVIDNFEHVLDAADQVQSLIGSCPELVCLVTSRAPLDLYGEHVYPLDPLRVTGPDDEDGPAIALFVERAHGADPHLTVEAHHDDIRSICTLLDGLPLAIELAALRTRTASPAEILGGLRGEGGVATLRATVRGRPERQRSAEGAVAWSAGMLSAPTREVLASASAFSGAFDPDALASVAGLTRDDVLPMLDELATNALVQRAVTGDADVAGRRYRLLAVVREHGRHHLGEHGRLAEVRTRHAAWVAGAVEAVSPGIEAWPERDAIDALDALDPDAQAALAWCFGSDPAPALAPTTGSEAPRIVPARDASTGGRIVAAMMPLWYFRGQVTTCLRWAEALHGSPDPAVPQHQADYYLAVSRWSAGDLDRAYPLMVSAVAGAEAAADATWLAEALGMQQLFALSAGDLAGAAELAPRCLVAADAAGPEWQLLAHLRSARLALLGGDVDAAETHVDRAGESTAHHGGTWGRANVAGARGDVLLARNDPAAAIERYLEAVEAFLAVDSVVYAVARTATIANALAVAGDHLRAAAVCGLVDGWCDELGAPLHPIAAFSYPAFRAQVADALGAEFELATTPGREAERTAASVRDLATPLPG